ncbi:Pyridoxal phosphate-dependent transferase major region subdomain 2 [Penicillium mononematosum]|uniref:Pyridoxal phosphate-dependent transferase major region subdomain 2 n=1 Tax=Penicillium mononematosum TaxID=268346 RepID=UPI002548E041|nr:Pyridoxal phosphate-dependent transferase major region subdomain 2 [Penicillium mononematosum]KAJ6187830.1 Pyridoxal phosphate-dependent transferase major region subdomain 2 [Penicillium mononematosum]
MTKPTDSSPEGIGASDIARDFYPDTATVSLSDRSRENTQWFMDKHMRQVARLSAKERRINMMTAENWLARSELINAYKRHIGMDLSPSHLSYADGLGGDVELLQAAAGFFNRYFHPHTAVEPQHIVTGAGCSSLLEGVLYDVCEPGDGVLIETPFWGGFETTFVLRAKVQAVHVQVPSDPSVRDVGISSYISAYETAMANAKCTIKAILFCNPHNPRGSLYSTALIEALLQFAERNNLYFLSDEIYALSIINSSPSNTAAGRFVSVLEMDLAQLRVLPARVCVLYSISKDLGSSGLRLGFAIVQSHPDLRLSLGISNHSKTSTLTSVATTALLRDEEGTMNSILEHSRLQLWRASQIVVEFLSFHNIPFYAPAAGVYIWARLGYLEDTWKGEADLNDKMEAAGVSVGAGRGYNEAQPGWFRITFALPETELLEGLRRIEDAMGSEHKWQGKGIHLLNQGRRFTAEREISFTRSWVALPFVQLWSYIQQYFYTF